ncbi:MAG: LysR family transcriptional regulator [Rhodobacteraceae bacterium]|nr:LysR family transcriptional regulator [Paracoccaceae bacterium]
MYIKLRHLEVFHAVMEEGSISKAATRLNLSQPAVSIALTNLEEIVGYSLFHRSKGHFSPRPEAFLLKSDAELSVMAVERFGNRASLIGRGGTGYIRVGSIGAPAFSVLPRLMSRFTAENPLVEVDLQVRSSAQIAYLVGNGQLDIGLVEAPVAAANVTAQEFEVPCVCIMSEQSSLAGMQSLGPKDLSGHRLIGIDRGNQVERALQKTCADAGVPLNIFMRGFFFAVVRRMVSEGGGIAVVDALNGMQELADGVVSRPFQPTIHHRLAMITNSISDLSQPAQQFAALLSAEIEWVCEI